MSLESVIGMSRLRRMHRESSKLMDLEEPTI